MFLIGDKVVYPMQGIGIIDRIEDKIFSGKNKEYIIVKILSNNTSSKVELSVILRKFEFNILSLGIIISRLFDRILNSNLRKITDNSTLEDVLFDLTNKTNKLEGISAKERYQNNMTKIKSGSLKDSAEVVYDLILMNKEKSLNSSEKQLFNTAHKFLVQEVSFIKDISETEATDFLNLNLC